MRSYTTSLFLLLALLLGAVPQAYSQAPTPGSCLSGQAEKDLDINNVLARMFNTGSLFYGGSTTNGLGYLVPQAAGNLAPIFASGIWIGGTVDGNVVTAGSRYQDFEFWPGPLNDDGTLPNPNNCSAFDRIYKVSEIDIRNFEAGLPATADLAQWPAELGAPVFAAGENGFDDDGDGLVDEGEDLIDNDGDGFIDERDERERAVASVRQAAGRSIYDLAGGDRPEIIGNQALWWVMNDLGNTHVESESPPIGVEVQVLAFSFARADALNDVTFYKYTVIKKTPGTLEETFFSIFSDPDLGNASDDFVGVDTTLSLGYVYNKDEIDNVYGIPPATGYDFFQGPIVDADGDGERDDTLGVTRYSYFQNVANPAVGDPDNATLKYNFMQGLWGDGTPMTEQGDGYQTDGEVTLFAFPGNPVEGEFWSEENPDGTGTANPAGDRRLLVTTGPFDLEQGVAQDVVFGIVFGQGTNRLNSIDVMRQADALAQAAYDADFELAAAPPPPPLCDTNSPNPELRPGSGNCLEAVEINREAALIWGYPRSNPNYLGSYEVFDQLIAAEPVSLSPDKTYNFEGFNIYQYANSNFEQSERELLATYDVINGVTTVIDTAFSAEIGDLVPFLDPTTAKAEDSGIRYTFDLTQLGLTNYTDYYFGISAYAYNFWSVPKVIESAPTNITVRPSNVQAGNGGSVQNADLGDLIVGTRTGGAGNGTIVAEVVDPTRLTGATYTVEFFSFDTGTTGDPDSLETTYRILRDGEEVFDGQQSFNDGFGVVRAGEQRIVIDGIEFTQSLDATIPAAFAADATGAAFLGDTGTATGYGIVEIANPSADVCAEGSSDTDIGCRFADYLGGNTVWLSPNSTGDYVVTNPGNDITDLNRDVAFAAPDDFEMRFTEACATPGACLAIYSGAVPGGSDLIASVPFEIWNVRNSQNGFANDDVRMIPVLRAPSGEDPASSWTDSAFDAMQDVIVRRTTPTAVTNDTLELGISHRVLWTMPDRPDGYALFAADANSLFGGVGGTYDAKMDGDTEEDIYTDPDGAESPCRAQGYYIDFCYKDGSNRFVGPIGGLDGMMIADLAGDGSIPPVGTTIAFQTSPKPALSTGDVTSGDVIVFNTADLAFQTQVAEAAEEALDLIGIVPNPYMGVSAYETNNLDRVARFINLPDEVTIRIYTVSGTLIRTLRKDGPARSLDWDLNTHNQLPVASGMYLIHVDAPGIGERVLKFGVVNRRNRITIF